MEQVLHWLDMLPTGFFFFAGAVLALITGLTRFLYRTMQRRKLQRKFSNDDRKSEQQHREKTVSQVQNVYTQVESILQEHEHYTHDLRYMIRYPAFYDTSHRDIIALDATLEYERALLNTVESTLLHRKPSKKYTDEESELLQDFLKSPERLRAALRTVKIQVETRGWTSLSNTEERMLNAAENALKTLLHPAEESGERIFAAEVLYLSIVTLAERHASSSYQEHFMHTFHQYIRTTGLSWETPILNVTEDTMRIELVSQAIPTTMKLLYRHWKLRPNLSLTMIVENIMTRYSIDSVHLIDNHHVLEYCLTYENFPAPPANSRDTYIESVIRALEDHWIMNRSIEFGEIFENAVRTRVIAS